jgi:hypothetical protein
MTERRKFRSVAVPMAIWKSLHKIAKVNNRSPAQQIAYLVDVAKNVPRDKDILERYASLMDR